MGAVAGPLVAAGFVTPVNRATGTTPASTALNALQGENGSGEYGVSTPKPSGHRQLLTIGSSDRQVGGPLLPASPPCPPCESFRRHPQTPPTWEMASYPGPV